MSEASDREIADLDMSLAADGEWIELWALFGTQMIPVKVTCRAFVRPVSTEELAAGITQDSANVTISPTEINNTGWPGPWTPTPNESTNPGYDRRVPKKGYKAIINNKVRNIELAKPIYVDGELIRINLRVLG